MERRIEIDMKPGQASLIILLIAALTLTFGIATTRNAVVDTKVDTDTESLKQAFNAAESGVEYYLGSGKSANVYNAGVGSSATINESVINSTQRNLSYFVDLGNYTPKNDYAKFWLMEHDQATGVLNQGSYYAPTSVGLCFDNTFAGSLMVDVYYVNGANYFVKRHAFNVRIPGGGGFSNFQNIANPGTCLDYTSSSKLQIDIPLQSGARPILLVVKPIAVANYGGFQQGSKFVLKGSAALPSQGVEITSVGTSGQAQRTVRSLLVWATPFDFMFQAMSAEDGVLGN